MNKISNFSLWTYLLFPGIAMLLGWGLRGEIGGGPFGAMIPGAMVALAISMLLGLRPGFTALIVVFGVVGVGLGGEMTYGQTLAFLLKPETVWWGNLATATKGAVWGIGGGAILGLGLVHRRIPKKTILIAFGVLMIGLLLGFKLINDPKLVYFSDPVNKPRSESWAALLFGTLAFIGYLKFKIEKEDFKIVFRFAKWGLIGGALGFGIGGLWFVLGSHLPGVVFNSWWKMMEFTFGLIFGASLGYAAWLSRDELKREKEIEDEEKPLGIGTELLLILAIGIGFYGLFPAILEPAVDQLNDGDGIISGVAGDILRVYVNYAFYGFFMLFVILYKKELAWQIGISLTFCHTIIDLMGDLKPQPGIEINPWIQLAFITVSFLIVAYLVSKYRHGITANNTMFQVLIWSTIIIAMTSRGLHMYFGGGLGEASFVILVVRTFFVQIVFVSSAIYTSYMSWKISKLVQA